MVPAVLRVSFVVLFPCTSRTFKEPSGLCAIGIGGPKGSRLGLGLPFYGSASSGHPKSSVLHMSRIAPTPDSADFLPVTPSTDPTEERALAWIGDAVLGLFAREHVLKRLGRIDTPAFLDLTSNAFLSALGRATRVEAEVGLVYQRDGLAGAFTYIEARILPHWRVQEAKRVRQRKKE